ncbi:MAG: PepSY domain-containing protein [Turicibacter sp.]|nr:PepSY domain-containing protein [Turicibacter sp.]
MNKKNKFLKRSILLIIVIIGSSLLLFSSYVLKYPNQLMTYQASLAHLPEVSEVLEIAMYEGQEEYYVAKVLLTSGKEYYYFIKDNTVEISCPVEEIMTPEQAEQKALALVQGRSKHYYLGIYDESIIYEVLISANDYECYVILDAKTGDVLLQFEI